MTLSSLKESLPPISDWAREQAESPIEYHLLPRSVVHVVRPRHSGHCAVSSEKGTRVADHAQFTRERLGSSCAFTDRATSSLQCK
jgi:hypothetical protein